VGWLNPAGSYGAAGHECKWVMLLYLSIWKRRYVLDTVLPFGFFFGWGGLGIGIFNIRAIRNVMK